METFHIVNSNTFSSIFLLQLIHSVFGPCQLLSLVALFICAAVFTAALDPMRFPWDFFTLYLSLPGRWQPRSHSLTIRQWQTPSAHLLSLSVLSLSLCVSRASGVSSSIYFLLTVFPAQASHVSKQQLVSFLHVWQCEVTIISVLIRFQFDVALLQFLRNSTVIPWQPYQFCLFLFNVPFLTAT